MWELIGLTALVLGIVAVTLVNRCRSAIRNQQADLDYLSKKLANLEKSPHTPVKDKATTPPPEAPAKPSTLDELLSQRRQWSSAPPPPAGAAEPVLVLPGPLRAGDSPAARLHVCRRHQRPGGGEDRGGHGQIQRGVAVGFANRGALAGGDRS